MILVVAPALEVNALTRRFGETLAVDSLTFTREPGKRLELLGRIGAGKSTTIKLATGLLKPTTESVRILGYDSGEGDALEAKRPIGVLPEAPQYLRFVGRLHGPEDPEIDRRRDELFDLLDLRPAKGGLIASYSYGMKNKDAPCAALMRATRGRFGADPAFAPLEGLSNGTTEAVR